MSAAEQSKAPSAQAKKPRMSEDQIAAAVVVGFHRIVKQSTLYTTENEAQRRQLEMTQRAVLAYGRRTGRNPKMYFTDNSVFVCGRLLRAGRQVYEAGLELGRILGRFGVDELTVGFDVPVEELRQFQQHTADAIRRTGTSPAQQRYTRIRMRRGHPPGRRPGKQDDELSPQEQVVRGYATAIVVVRRFLETIQEGKYEMPVRVRRVAQQLADLGAVEAPAFLGTTALYNARHEHAGRAVNSALVALGMARQLTDDNRMLSRIAMAALLYDVGLPRIAGMGPTGEGRVGMALPRLGEEQYGELPAATAVSTTALGGFSDAGMTHSVLVYEALFAHHQSRIGLPYGGIRPVTIEARIVATARRFTELLADPDEELNADQSIATLQREAKDEADKTTVRLLMCAIGLFPTGTLVELSNGTIAQVVATSDNPMKFSHPVVRPVVDASGASVGQHGEIDLASQTAGGVRVVRIVGMGDQHQVAASSKHREQARRAQKRTQLGLGLTPDTPEAPLEVDDRFGAAGDYDSADGVETDFGQAGAADYGADQAGAADYGAADYGAADYGAADYGAADYGAADYGADQGGDAFAATADDGGGLDDRYAIDADAISQGQPAAWGQGADPRDWGGSWDQGAGQQGWQEAPPAPAGNPPSPAQQRGQASSAAARGGSPLNALFDDLGDGDLPPLPDMSAIPSFSTPAPPSSSRAARPSQPQATPRPHPSSPGRGIPGPTPSLASFAVELDGDEVDADDEDDVPSMVLQAIVDGRSTEGDEAEEGGATSVFTRDAASPLAALFFKATGEQAETSGGSRSDADAGGQATAVISARDAMAAHRAAGGAPALDDADFDEPAQPADQKTVPKPRARGGLMAAARDAAVSQGTPLPGTAGPSARELEEARQRVMQRGAPSGSGQGGGLAMPPQRRGPAAAAPEDSSSGMAMPPKRSSRVAARAGGDAGASGSADTTRRRLKTAEWLRNKLTGARPTSQGSLAKTPLVHLIVYMLDRALTGTTMLVAEGARTHFIYFHEGVPSKVRSSDHVAPLGEVLQELGLVEATEIDQALRVTVPGGQLLGRYLVQQGKLDVGSVKAALSWQLVRKMTHLFTFPSDTRWAYYQDVNLLDDYGGPELTPAEPLAVIMAGVRMLGSSPVVEQTLARLGGAPLRLRREAEVGRFMLTDDERRAVDLLRARPASLRDLLQRGVSDERTVKLAIYALVITRCLNLGAQQREPVGHSRPAIEVPRLHRDREQAEEIAEDNPFDEQTIELDEDPGAPVAADSGRGAQRPQPRRADSGSRGGMPRRGTASRGRSPSVRGQPLPRRGSSSALGAPMPSRGVSRSQGLPRRGTSSADGSLFRPSSVAAEAPPEAPNQRGTAPRQAPPRRNAPTPTGAMSHADVEAKLGGLDDKNYYELLDSEPKASAEQIQAAYFQLAKQWHPDRLPDHLKDVRSEVAKIFARINEAHATLNNTDKRKEYDELLKSGGGTARDREIVERVVDAGLLFQKGEVMFKKGAYAHAEALVQQALDADPDQPEYRALLAWIQAHRLGPPAQSDSKSNHYEMQIRLLDEVLIKDPKFARAFYYRGELLKRSGQTDKAIHDFRTVTRLDPRNIDAAREVRLHDLRDQKKKSGGLFGKFFKGK